MHIAINGYFWGHETTGSGQYLWHLLRSLISFAPEHVYTLFIPGQRLESIEGLRIVSVPVSLRDENLAKLAFEQVGFPRACWRERVALAHVPYFASPLLPSVPTVVTIHDLIPLLLPAYRGDWRVRLYMRLVSLGARRASAIITDSLASQRDIVRVLGIPPERVHIVYLAAEERFRPVQDPAALAAVRQRYGLPSRYILYLGGFDQRRNIAMLLRAFARAIAMLRSQGENPLPHLVLAGHLPAQDSAFTPDPRRLVRELGLAEWVQCIGRVEEADKPSLYSAADLFVFPSLYEGFGLPPLEAMACGVPVIAANTASLPEIVGAGGLLVGACDEAGWAITIAGLWLQEERRQALRQRSLAQAARFSWERTAEQTLQVYERR